MKRVLYLGLDPTHYACDGKLVHLPLICIAPRSPQNSDIQNCLRAFKHYTHILLTSKSTIPILLDILPLFGLGIDDWKDKVTLAVGKTTASHLEKIGIHPKIVAKEETAEGLLAEIDLLPIHESSFFWPHSAQARSVIMDYFKEKQSRFSECSLYETKTLVPKSCPSLKEFDEIVFTSPSTVDAFLQIFGPLPNNKILTPIGPVTRNYLTAKKPLSQ